MSNPIYFDIETGGLEPRGKKPSSVLSISFGRTGEVQELFSHPEPGSFVSAFSQQEILPQVQSATQTFTEKQSIMRLVEHLEANPGADLVGFNSVGFDTPFLRARANDAGIGRRFEGALKGRRHIDVGLRAKLALSRGISDHIEQGTFSEVLGGAKTFSEARVNLNRGRLTADQSKAFRMLSQIKTFDDIQETPKDAYKHMRGWKLTQIYGVLDPDSNLAQKAHQASADIMMTERIHEALKTGEFSEKLKDPKIARHWLQESLQLKAKADKINKGEGFYHHPSRVNQFRESASRIPRGLRHGMAGGAIALAALGLVGLAFSGSDDEYNELEGLGHKGIAWQIRQRETDFGSGFQVKGLFSRIFRSVKTPSKDVVLEAADSSKHIAKEAAKGDPLSTAALGLGVAEAGHLAHLAYSGSLTAPALDAAGTTLFSSIKNYTFKNERNAWATYVESKGLVREREKIVKMLGGPVKEVAKGVQVLERAFPKLSKADAQQKKVAISLLQREASKQLSMAVKAGRNSKM